MPACKTAQTAVQPSKELKDRYHVLSYDMEQEMNQTEVNSQNLVSAESVPQSVLYGDNVSGEEQEKWFQALQLELENMEANSVLKAATREEAKDYFGASELPVPVPSKLVLTRKPTLDAAGAKNSAAAAATEASMAWNAKVRLVACGNFQADTQPHMLENYSANPSQEVVRLMLSMLARHPEWTALVLDISCAFLNAWLGDEKVLLRPPPALVRLGLIAPNVLWIVLRAIYGLRKSPKLWVEERNRTLDYRILKKTPGSETGDVMMTPLESGAWVLQSDGACVGLFMMYVDDGLLVGPRELLQRLGLELRAWWALKYQGFLSGADRAEGSEVELGSDTVLVHKELNFLGMKIRRCSDQGILLHQTPWLQQELNKRGWLHMKGPPSLPNIPEGIVEPMARDDNYAKALKRAQSEVGCLQWIALRSRPDIAATVGSAACMSTVHPGSVSEICQGIWRYLSSTRDHGVFAPCNDPRYEDVLWRYGDASLAPGASRSRTGVIIQWGEHVLSWKSQRRLERLRG